jgi:hypothetical protein
MMDQKVLVIGVIFSAILSLVSVSSITTPECPPRGAVIRMRLRIPARIVNDGAYATESNRFCAAT